MRKLGKILTWTMAFFFLPTLVGCGDAELGISSEDDMTMEYEQGRSDKTRGLDTSAEEEGEEGDAIDPACADFDLDGRVDQDDLNTLIAVWGDLVCVQACPCPDLNGSGAVDGADVGLFLGAWGYGDPSGETGSDVGGAGDDVASVGADNYASLSDGSGKDDDDEAEDGKQPKPSFSTSKYKG